MAKKKKTGRKKSSGQKKNSPENVSALSDKTTQISQDKKQQEKKISNKKSSKNKVKELEKPNYIEQLITFLKEVKAEFKKITWATKKETIATTIVVLAITFFFAAYLGLVDIIFSKIISLLLY